MALSQIQGDQFFNGNVAAISMTIPASSIGDSQIAAGSNVSDNKLMQRRYPSYSQVHGSAATTVRIPFYRCKGATATINKLRALVVVIPVGAATVSIQLKKNGSNILSSALVLDNANVAFTAEDAAGFTSASLVTGDVLELDITATAGGGTLPQGLYVEGDISETPL
jgi:hypothetical protein